MRIHKQGDKYEAVLPNEDLSEIEDLSLDELLAWVNGLRGAHGGGARFELNIHAYDRDAVAKNYIIHRPATSTEIAAYEQEQTANLEKKQAEETARNKRLYEQLKAQFEPKA